MSHIENERYKPCVSRPILTRKHCEILRMPGGRCRKRAALKCCHGIHCREHDQWLHEVVGRNPGDFVCAICSTHFHDGNDPAVSAHIGMHATDMCATQGTPDEMRKAEVADESMTMQQKIAAMTKKQALAWILKPHATPPTMAEKASALFKAGLTDGRGVFYHMMEQAQSCPDGAAGVNGPEETD